MTTDMTNKQSLDFTKEELGLIEKVKPKDVPKNRRPYLRRSPSRTTFPRCLVRYLTRTDTICPVHPLSPLLLILTKGASFELL
jgi:hypothetical protein